MLPTYDFSLVVFSVVIAIISSLTALDLAGRVTAATDRGRNFWVAGGAVAMGSGIWSMHFIAMLAYKLPVPTAYNGQIVFVSLVVAIFVAGLSLYIISHESLGKLQFWVSGSIMGGAIALMHYIGMAALQLEAKSVYNTPRVALSVLVAIAGSYAALGLTFYGRKDATVPFWRKKSASVLIMGSAIAGMHYIGMSAVCWQVTNTSAIGQYSQKHSSLALAIGIATLIILGLALQAAFVDRRLKIEVTLAESQRRLATLIDSLPGIVFSTNNDPNWTMTYLSEGCFNLTGYHSFELVGTQGAYNAITHPEDLPNILQSIDAAIANQQPYVVEYRIKSKSGQYKWLWEKGSAVFSNSGQLLGLEGFITDITKLKDSQEGLRQAEAKYRSIFENAVEGIFQTTIDGKYISANPALARIYGYESPQALIALVEIDRQLYVEPHHRQEFLRLIQEHGSVSGFESKVYRQDGSIIWISENVRTVKNASGVIIYYEGTVEDISDRKQLSDRLESRVEERTAQLRKANYQLQSEIVERQKAEQEVRLLQAMTQAISESPDFHSALTVALQKICQYTGWSFGEAWIPCPNSQNLTYSCSWYSNQKLAEFSNASKKITFAANVGLPGRVWAAKQPEWIEDVSIAGNNIFLRASLAKQVGIKAGLAVPIVGFTSGETTEVLAVLVFFMFDSCHEDKRQVELVRAIATGLDTLMQRKRAESALRKSEERYRAVVEQTSEGIFLIDTETKRILQSNAAFERLLGYTSAEILQLQLYDLVALDPEIIEKNALRVLQEQHDFIAEAPHRRKDGSLVWTEVNVSCIFYNDRNVFCAIVRDITDRKLAEMALYSSLATNRALINAIPDLIFRLNREGVFVNFKASKDNNLLLSPDYFMGKNVYDVMPLDVAQPTMHYIHQALATNEVQIFEYQLQLEQLRDYEARLVVSAEDEVMAIVRDITERKRAEADMHHALAKEKELSLLKSRFVTMTSHEFRTPLTTILSSAELLEKYSFKWSEEKKLQHFWRIQTSVKQMTQLLEDVLLIGKAEAEKLEFQPSTLDLKQFCADLADEIQTLTEKHQINFTSHSDRTLGQMDEKLLRHIFNNLLVNAIKYSPQGGEIKFELICEQDTAIFRVQDSGIGIPKNEQAKLFDSFHRASNVGTISGTGLGLAIVKKSVDLHAGKIEVESQVDIGTTFTVSLPLNC